MTTKHKRDLIDDIVADHREVEAAFAEIEFSDQPDRELVEHVIAELVRHSVAEEQYVYPTARRVLPDGDALADHEIEEHAEAEEVRKRSKPPAQRTRGLTSWWASSSKISATTFERRRATCCRSCAGH